MTTIDEETPYAVTFGGDDIQEITIDGETVWTAVDPPAAPSNLSGDLLDPPAAPSNLSGEVL